MGGFYRSSVREGQRLRQHWSIAAAGIAAPFAVVHGPHRYWRILFDANNGSPSFDGIGEMEYRATLGGADQAPTATSATTAATASSSVNSSNLPWQAFDGGESSSWLSASAGASWLKYDFGSQVSVAQVAIMGPSNSIASSPKDFRIQYSDDDATWTTAQTVTGQTGWSAGVFRTFAL